ncbi:hypothetical protein ACFL6U_23285 [Planctomycetota bacterium]
MYKLACEAGPDVAHADRRSLAGTAAFRERLTLRPSTPYSRVTTEDGRA